MKNLFKKTLSVLLAVVMTFTITLPAFAEENSAPETQTEQELGYNSSNALGDAIVSAINEEDASRDEYDGMGIFNVSLIGLEAQVALSAPDGCTVVVAVYEEETMQMVTSGKADVCSDDMEIVVTLADFELPDFFVVKAFILNSENAPVCHSYIDLYNTKAYVEAMSKTTEDFDSDLVINLDDSATDNFAVVTDDALSVQSETDKNVLVSADEENGIYVIENADSSVLALNVGDILYFTYGEGANDYILTKIGKMETEDGLTTITAADDCEMSEFFDYVDIDTSKYNEPQTYSLRRDFDEESGQLTQTKSFPITTGSAEMKFSGSNWSLTFNLDGDVSFYVKFFYDVNLFKKDYYEFLYWVQVGAEAKVTFDFNASFEKKVTLIDTDFTIVPGLDIHFALRFTVKANASLNVTGTVTFFMKNGASRNSDGVQQKIEQKPTVTFAADVSGSFSIDLIPEIETGFRIVKVFFVDLNVPVDFNVTGTLFVPTTAEDKAKHGCIICVDGKIKVTVSLTVSVKFGLKREKAKSIISFTPVNKPIPLGSFYMSGSGSGIKFGWGECPNINSGSADSGDDNTGTDNTDPDNPGTGGSGSGSSGTGGSGSDVEDTRTVTASGTCGENLTWTLYEDGELVISGTGKMTDYSSYESVPWKSYKGSIKSVTIGNGVTTIGNYAFYNCTALASVTIPDSVTTIGIYAFYNCSKLASVTIGNGVTSIGDYAFYSCYSLTSVTIPDSVTTIGGYAFGLCTSLTSVTVDENNANYSSDEYGVLFNKDKTELIQYPIGNERTEYTIPDSVTTIGDYAFRYCDNLTSVTIGNSVTTIGYYAFHYCRSLTSVTIGNSVTTIGDDAFSSCDSLTSVTIGNSVTTIGNYAFRYCDSLTSVTIPDSVTTVGYCAFYDCTSLTSVTIGNSVTTIGDYAFDYCTGLTSVTIPDSVTTIGDYAFDYCTGLTSVTIPDSVTTIGGCAFSNCHSLTNVTIPDSVTTIGYCAFSNCHSLTNVTIPDSVTTIGYSAFYNCTDIATVYYTGTLEQWNAISIGSNNFNLTNANIICSDTVAPAMFMLMSFDDEIAAYSPRAAVQNETVISAILGNSYVILVVKNKNAEDLLAAENLIYIDQKIAESETLTFDFDLNGETDYDVIITNAELNHSHKYTAVVTAPDCTEQGYTTYTCYCGDTYTASYIDALGHTEEIISGTPADCINEGITDGIICSVCKAELIAQELILAKGHTNTNGDNYCGVCGYDFALDCSHNCHSNNAFLKFFWQIALFFSKLFNIQSNRYCDCGIAHW